MFRRLRNWAELAGRLQEAEQEVEELRRQAAIETDVCMRCGRTLPWKELNDESTQEERWVICLKCIDRRNVARTFYHAFRPKEPPGNPAKCLMCNEPKGFVRHEEISAGDMDVWH
jgi:DNA-directed RNA polymerase subunit RPC12/RpoP